MYPYADNIKDLIGYISRMRRISYRFMIEKIDNEPKVTRLIIGAPEAKWGNYNYNGVAFQAGTENGTRIANWLHTGIVHNDRGDQFPIIPMSDSVYCTRHPSHSQGGLFTISKPFTMYRVSFQQAIPSRNYELASQEAPFFFSLWEAERHILYDIPQDSLSSVPQTPEPAIYVYIEHPEVWLERIHFSLAALEINLGGDLLAGTTLQVVGSGIEEYNSYVEQRDISIPLPNGRPDYLKIALLAKDTWLDYFIDDRRLPPNPFAPKRDNVTFAEPEPQEKVRDLIDRGEGRTIEFKHSLKSCSNKIKWLKTIIAFANGDGGSLIIGVNDEDGAIVGIEEDLVKHNGSIAKFEDEIATTIRDMVSPEPEYAFVRAIIDGKNILAIDVERSNGRCHAAYQNKEVPVFYIRRAATTRVADHNEIQELVRLKSPPPPPQQMRSPFIGHISQE